MIAGDNFALGVGTELTAAKKPHCVLAPMPFAPFCSPVFEPDPCVVNVPKIFSFQNVVRWVTCDANIMLKKIYIYANITFLSDNQNK